MRLLRRFIVLLVILVVLTGAGILMSVYLPYRHFNNEVFLDFPKGTPTRVMADRLAQAGVIQYAWQFLVARALRPSAKLQAGEYRFAKPASAVDVLARIAKGDVFYYELRVAEGSNIFDIGALVAKLGTISSKEYLAAAADPSSIRDLDPQAQTLEGYLFPSTYRLTRSTTAPQLLKQMTDEFRRNWKKVIAGRQPAPNVHDTVTLASLIEKETAIESERPLVASVYSNRLRLGMKLDCDPTTIYAAMLEDRYRGTIARSDLASRNRYNTYQHPGLPPGPITNPGAASLKAALSPAETKFLYFVAKPGGGASQFSVDYDAHERAVAEYRRGLKAAH
jgi:UPF0755 protein